MHKALDTTTIPSISGRTHTSLVPGSDGREVEVWLSQRRIFSALDTAPLSRVSVSESHKEWQRCVYCILEPGILLQAL